MSPRLGAVLAAFLGVLVLAAGAGAAVGPPFTPVMTGLDNPRGLGWGPAGGLYVAEAGRGGNRKCFTFEGFHQFAGATGAVSRLLNGVQTRVARGFPSYADEAGVGATGPHDISFDSLGNGKITIGLGLGDDPRLRSTCKRFGPAFGWLAEMPAFGTWSATWRLLADIVPFEVAVNPDGGALDTNPYGVHAVEDGTLVADAGGNALLHVADDGTISALAAFPSRVDGRPTDSVPTSVARGPDGAYYVGELTGFPFDVGAANVWRVVPGEEPTVFEAGFTSIIDITFGEDGSLYVLEFATEPFLEGAGDLIRVEPDGTRTVIAEGFFTPGSVVIGADGAFYVSNCSIFPGAGPFPCNGEVVRFEAED